MGDGSRSIPVRVLGQPAHTVSPQAGRIDTATAIDLLEMLQSILPPIKAADARGDDVPCIAEYQTADDLRRRLEVFVASATRGSLFTISDQEAQAVEIVIMCAEGFPGTGAAAQEGEDSRIVLWIAAIGIAGLILIT